VGDVVRGSTLANGLQLRQVRVPLGVVGIVYEARPNVTVDAAGLCLKSGNAALLRGSASAHRTNTALVAVLTEAAEKAGLPAGSIALLPADRASVGELLNARGLVDVVIPRGGASLIQRVVTESRVPVIETGVGNCHVYVDASADPAMAEAIVLNAKTHRVSVCNAAETLLVHRDVAPAFLPMVAARLTSQGVELRVDRAGLELLGDAGAGLAEATDADYDTEFLAMVLAVRVVESLDEALDHIARHGSGHSEAIVTGSLDAATRFHEEVDAAAVYVNASTRFTDGAEFGMGAEIGISTQKLHARGPIGLVELTSYTYLVTGRGHVR
jgi:glutamate-5-semialdehyde dehydrogenase